MQIAQKDAESLDLGAEERAREQARDLSSLQLLRLAIFRFYKVAEGDFVGPNHVRAVSPLSQALRRRRRRLFVLKRARCEAIEQVSRNKRGRAETWPSSLAGTPRAKLRPNAAEK